MPLLRPGERRGSVMEERRGWRHGGLLLAVLLSALPDAGTRDSAAEAQC